MHDDHGDPRAVWRPVLLFAALALVFAAGHAQAIPINGRATLQYQHVDQKGRVFYPNGIIRDTSITRSFWSQSYVLNHAASLGRGLSMYSQLEFVDESYDERPHVSQTATATMRLSHPLFGLGASYRPSVSKVAATSLGVPGDVGLFRPSTSRNDQTSLTANFMPPRLPRLDLSWVRQRVDAELGGGRRNTVSRSANLIYGAGAFDVRAGYGDQRGDLGSPGTRLSDRRHGNAGFGIHLDPLPTLALGLQYDLSLFTTQVPAGPTNRSLSHRGSVSGSLRASQHTGVDLAYSYQTSRQSGAFASRQGSHDGSLVVAYRPNSVASASVGTGFRTLNAERAPVTERYLSGGATASGRIRTGWSGTAAASHNTLWDRDAQMKSSESVNLATSLRGSRDFQLGGTLTTTLNSDGSVGAGRWATDGSISLSASPVRKLQLTAGMRSARSGPSLVHPSSGARSRGLDVRWFPSAAVDLSGNITQSLASGGSGVGSTTRSARLGLRPGTRVQLSGSYSRSDQTSQIAGTSQLRGREVFSTQLSLAVTRTISVGANLNLVDPHGQNFSRQYDLNVTKDFRR